MVQFVRNENSPQSLRREFSENAVCKLEKTQNVCLTFSRNINSNLNNTQKLALPETLFLGYLKIEDRSIIQNIIHETSSRESSEIAVEHTETCNITFHDHAQFTSRIVIQIIYARPITNKQGS